MAKETKPLTVMPDGSVVLGAIPANAVVDYVGPMGTVHFTDENGALHSYHVDIGSARPQIIHATVTAEEVAEALRDLIGRSPT